MKIRTRENERPGDFSPETSLNFPKKTSDITEKIDKFIEYFTTITKEQSDYIESILNWDDETKLAFRIAKRMFEEDIEK